MRCKNCHTVMMETDTHCPSCRSPVERATAAAPGTISEKPNGLLMMLPLFGGALGGLAYAAITAGQTDGVATATTVSPGTTQPGGSSPIRKIVGVVFMLLGGLFFVLASIHAFDTWDIAKREPKTVTAEDLCRKDFAATAPAWLAYTFTESKPLEQTITRRRLGRGGDVQARGLLVRADNQWLVATVASGFEGKTLVGRILPGDMPVSQGLIERARRKEADTATVLPFEFNAVDGCASDQQARFLAAMWIGIFGVAALLIGYCMLPGRQRQVQASADPAFANWSYQTPSAK